MRSGLYPHCIALLQTFSGYRGTIFLCHFKFKVSEIMCSFARAHWNGVSIAWHQNACGLSYDSSVGGRPVGMQWDCTGRIEINKPTVIWTACSKVLLKLHRFFSLKVVFTCFRRVSNKFHAGWMAEEAERTKG